MPPPAPTSRRAAPLWALLASLMALLAACSGGPTADDHPTPGDGPPRLLILSSLIGYVEPCGCTVDLLLGGVDRVAARVAAERAEGPTAVLVVGSTFYEAPPPAHRVGQDDAKADLLARSLKKIGTVGLVRGPEDLARGPERAAALLKTTGAADLTANVAGGQGQLVTLGELKVGVFGLADPEHPGPSGGATDPAAAAKTEAKRLRGEGATVVVALGALPRRALRLLSREVPEVDLWVLGDAPTEAATLSPAGDASYLVEAGDRGRNLGRVVLLDATAPGPLADPVGEAARKKRSLELQLEMKTRMSAMNKDPDLAAQIIALKKQIAEAPTAAVKAEGKRAVYSLVPVYEGDPRDPEVQGWMAAYNESLKALNLAAAGEPPPVPPGGSKYVGVSACNDCHAEAVAQWKTTPHARAWATLEAAEKTFDAECVSCHVVGYMQPGGTVLGRTEGKENVQCEACHGPAEIHVDRGGSEAHIRRLIPEEVCVPCHNSHHSPKFDYESYRPKILGPGHGAPLATTTPVQH